MTINIKNKKIDLLNAYIHIYIALIPWDLFNSMKAILSGLLLILWAFQFKKNNYLHKIKRLPSNRSLLLIGLFLLYICISLLWSKNINYGIMDIKRHYIYWFILIPVFFTSIEKDDIEKLIKTIVFSLGLYALYSLLIFAKVITLYSQPNGHIAYSVVSMYMAINTFFASIFFVYSKKEKYTRYVFLAIAILSFCALVVSDGRIAQVSFIGTVLVLMVYFRKNLFQKKKLMLSLFFALIVGFFLIHHLNKTERYIRGFAELTNSISTKHFHGSWGARAYMWYVASDTISAHPFFGSGVGDAFDEVLKYIEKSELKLHHSAIMYHNQHLNFLAAFGVFGYLLFALSVLLLLKQLFKTNKRMFIFGLIFFTMVFLDSFGNDIVTGKPFNNFFIIVFILFSIVAYDKSNYVSVPGRS